MGNPRREDGRADGRHRHGVEREQSPVISGIGFRSDVLDVSRVDRVEKARDRETMDDAYRRTREEGILSGVSCGAAVAVAAGRAKTPEFAEKTIVVILPDAGKRYRSTSLCDRS